MEPKYKVNPLTGELQEYVFEYNGILALRNFTARVEDERLILHAADDVNFSILEALVSEVEINGVVYDNPTAAQEALTRLTFNQNRPVLLDKTLKDLILGAVQKIPGKKLSTEDFTTELRQKLEGLQQVDTSGLLPKGGYTGTAQDLKNLIDAINRILQSDDTDLDQLQEIVEYIKQNKHILSTLGISNIAGLVDALAAKAEKNHHHDERYALRTHRHNWDDIDGKPNNLATTENVKTAVDGVQIGGRNLVLRSKLNVTNNSYGIASIMLSEEPKVGEELTVTIKGVLGAGKRVFTLYNKSGMQELCMLQNKGNGIFQSTFNWRSDPANPKLLVIYIYDVGVVVNSTIEWIKLERGNKPTDWSPAPEDAIPVPRAGAAIGSNWTAAVEHQNNTIFVENSLSIELNQLQNLGSVSFIKTFDNGAVTFTCAGKTIIMKGDTQFNGSKGSTAVVSIHNNDCYIRISNV